MGNADSALAPPVSRVACCPAGWRSPLHWN